MKSKTPPVAVFSPFPTPRPSPVKLRVTQPGLAAARRGRRPRRPERSSTAHLAAFRQPPAGAGFHPRPASDDCGRPQIAGAAGGGGRPQRGNPRRGFPLRPPPALCEHRETPRGSAPGPRPLFCKKAGQKTFKRQSTSDPSPSPRRRVIQSVREADTSAAEWHLPREWERRVGPETSRGRHHPKRLSLGLHPVSLGKHQRNGVDRQRKLKTTANKTASSAPPNPNPRAGMEPRPYRRVVRFRVLICPAVNKRAERRGRRPLQGLKRRCAEAAGGGAACKGGTPGEGSPFNPLLRFVEHKRVPRAAARGQGLRPWTPPAFL